MPSANPSLQILTHDSWMGPATFFPLLPNLAPPLADAQLPPGRGTTFGLDVHDYQYYAAADNGLAQPAHVRKVCTWAAPLRDTRAAGVPVYVGEWSALTMVYVRPDGSSFPGKDCRLAEAAGCQCTEADPALWHPWLARAVRRYVEAQMDVFEAASDGYFLWSFGGAGGWGVDNLVRAGAFPRTRGEREFERQC